MKRLKSNSYLIAFAIIAYLLGCYFSSKFGVSWDESHHRVVGFKALYFILNFFGLYDFQLIPKEFATYHFANSFYGQYGVIFDLTCSIIEKIFSIDDTKTIFQMRHMVNWSFYFVGIIYFFLLSKLIFKNKFYSIISLFIYVLHPRLLSHGFFNCTDSIAQVYIVVFLYFFTKAVLKNNFTYLIVSGVVCGVCVSTRIPIIYLPFLAIFILFLFSKTQNFKISIYKFSAVFFIAFLTGLYVFWPVLWKDPILAFSGIFKRLSNYPFPASNFFLGSYVKATNIDPYYFPVWFIVTTPISYTLFIVTSIFFFFKKLSNNKDFNTIFMFFMLSSVLIPFLAVITLKSVLYDGWRHLFFLYPFIALIAAYGFVEIFEKVKEHKAFKSIPSKFILILFLFISPATAFNSLFPLAQTYFNPLVNDPLLSFEGEYWGNSYLEGLNFILNTDTSTNIKIVSNTPSLGNNILILNTRDKARFENIKLENFLNEDDVGKLTSLLDDSTAFTDFLLKNKVKADYFLTNFRLQQKQFYIHSNNNGQLKEKEVFSLFNKKSKLFSVFKLSTDSSSN